MQDQAQLEKLGYDARISATPMRLRPSVVTFTRGDGTRFTVRPQDIRGVVEYQTNQWTTTEDCRCGILTGNHEVDVRETHDEVVAYMMEAS